MVFINRVLKLLSRKKAKDRGSLIEHIMNLKNAISIVGFLLVVVLIAILPDFIFVESDYDYEVLPANPPDVNDDFLIKLFFLLLVNMLASGGIYIYFVKKFKKDDKNKVDESG